MAKVILPAFHKYHLGDHLGRFNYINKYFLNGDDVSIADTLDYYDHYKTYTDVLNFPWKLSLTGETESGNVVFRPLVSIFSLPPIPGIILHDGTKKYNKITYTFTARYMKKEKINPEWESIVGYGSQEWQPVGKAEAKMTLLETMKSIAESDLLITPESGLAHLNRSIGTPMIILEHNKSVIEYFPHTEEYTLCKTNDDMKKVIDLLH
jgi:hypothetical protein